MFRRLFLEIVNASLPIIARKIFSVDVDKRLKLISEYRDKMFKEKMRMLDEQINILKKYELEKPLSIPEYPRITKTVKTTNEKNDKKEFFLKTVEYTKKNAIKHLILTEDHLKSPEKEVCDPCLLEKHFPALRGYAEEGLNYSLTEDERKAYENLINLVDEAEKLIKSGQANYKELADKFRNIRKKLSSDIVAAIETVSSLE